MSSNTLVQSLTQIVKGSNRESNPDLVLFDYRNEAAFRSLWLYGLKSGKVTIAGQEVDVAISTKQVLLVGNDPPDGVFADVPSCLQGANINFRSHFTATSWLTAWKVKFPDSKASVAVIDPRPADSATGVAQALQTIFSARDAAGLPLVPGATVLSAPSLEAICQWLKTAKSDIRSLAKDATHLRELLKSAIWNELTSNRDKHHALSNVLGAFLLGAQVGKGTRHAGESWIQDYLLALIRALGVEADLDQVRVKEHDGFQRWITPAQQSAIEGVVLIDDMGSLWEYFLRGATGFAGDAAFGETGRTFRESLACLGEENFPREIDALPERLDAFFDSGRRKLNASDILGGDSRLGTDFVLFLDLRLFGSSESELGDCFYNRIRDIAWKVLRSETRHRPWLDARSFTAFEEELDGGEDHPPETLLPRVISLLDPTLPIVIFSSTHRTELIDPFRSYGNIVIDFRKPILSGLTDWPMMVRDLHADFSTAITKAIGILATRKFLAKLEPSEIEVVKA
jgi:hypothetical protein